MARGFFKTILAAVVLALCASQAAAEGPFSDWAGVVVAGDWHAHSGAPSEVFDNARRDVAADLVRIGFSPANVVQFSVRPARYPDTEPRNSDGQTISTTLWDLSNRTDGGCLAYFTSHGSTDGIVMGVRHRELPVHGVQFHPESILTVAGHDLLRNFLAMAAAPAVA